MNRLIIKFLFITLTLGIVQASFAQSDEGWNIEQRCLNTPTATLPDDWSFSGTLMLTSPDKLHAYRQEWETPHILLFTTGGNIPRSGQLSPDGKWFAVIKGDSEYTGVVSYWTIDEIQVVDTGNDTRFTVEWNTWFGATHTLWGHFLEWLPDNKLLYSRTEADSTNIENEEWYVIDPFTSDVTKWESDINPTQDSFYLSPDGQKAVYGDYGRAFFLHNGQEELQLPIWQATWNPDSTEFATFIVDENFRAKQFAIYNIDGETDAVVLGISSEDWSRLMENAWSHDGRYLIFVTDKVYIADMSAEILIDPCIESDYVSVAWSPDNSQLTLIDRRNDDGKIQIIDFNLWKRFVVGYHTGDVIGWRADDE